MPPPPQLSVRPEGPGTVVVRPPEPGSTPARSGKGLPVDISLGQVGDTRIVVFGVPKVTEVVTRTNTL